MKRIKFEIEYISEDSRVLSLFIIKDPHGNEHLCKSYDLDDVLTSLLSD